MPEDALQMADLSKDWSNPGPASRPARPPHPLLGYGAGIGLVALATLAALLVSHILPSPNVALVFVLPVLMTAIWFGWGPAFSAAVVAVASFDFFFTQPFLSLRVASPADMWTMSLLLIVAAVASTVAAGSRRRGLESQAAAERAEALHRLAHLVVSAAPAPALYEAAAQALAQTFAAPAVVLIEGADGLRTAARAGGAALSDQDEEAARWTLANDLPTRAETFPFDAAGFDFWPLRLGGQGAVLGVGASDTSTGADRDRFVEMVGAYLAVGLARP